MRRVVVQPTEVHPSMPLDRASRRPPRRIVLLTIVIGLLVATVAVSTDAFGAGQMFQRAVARVDRFIAGPVPDPSTASTIGVTPAPASPSQSAVAPPASSSPRADSGATPTPTPAPAPSSLRAPVDIDIAMDPAAVFAHELKKTWCAAAGVQMTLAFLGLGDTSHDFQTKVQGRVREWESQGDSHNGNWGPSAMVLALEAYGAPGYEVRAYETRADALKDAAVAIEATRSPVILLAWRGAHTWVMTGFRADADPQLFGDATVDGAYILDPWYPWISSIWGPSDPPGTFQDAAEMERNYLRWKRPEGRYPERDGLFIAVVPTIVVNPVH